MDDGKYFFSEYNFIPGAFAQEKPFIMGMRVGCVIENWQMGKQEEGGFSRSEENSGTVLFSGVGNGVDFSIYSNYYFSNWGVMLELGSRILPEKKIYVESTSPEENEYYENSLVIFPITLSLMRKINISGSKIIPYFGLGVGVYISELKQRHCFEGVEGRWLAASSNPVGVHLLGGFDYPLAGNVLFGLELRCSYANADWEIKDIDRNDKTELEDIDIGGMSFKAGLGYKF